MIINLSRTNACRNANVGESISFYESREWRKAIQPHDISNRLFDCALRVLLVTCQEDRTDFSPGVVKSIAE